MEGYVVTFVLLVFAVGYIAAYQLYSKVLQIIEMLPEVPLPMRVRRGLLRLDSVLLSALYILCNYLIGLILSTILFVNIAFPFAFLAGLLFVPIKRKDRTRAQL